MAIRKIIFAFGAIFISSGLLLSNTCSGLEKTPIERIREDYPNQEIEVQYSGDFEDWYPIGFEQQLMLEYDKGWNNNLYFQFESYEFAANSSNKLTIHEIEWVDRDPNSVSSDFDCGIRDDKGCIFVGETLERNVKFVQKESLLSEEQQNAIDGIKDVYYIRDLEVINLMISNNSNEAWTRIPTKHRYSNEVRDYLNSSGIDIVWFGQGGGAYTQAQETFGAGYEVIENNILIGTVGITMISDNVIYIPEGTADNDEAIIEAIRNRILEYLGEEYASRVQISVSDNIDVFDFSNPDFNLNDPFSYTKNIQSYSIQIDDVQWLFYVERDNSKLTIPGLLMNDGTIGTEIYTESGEVPLDTISESSENGTVSETELSVIGASYGEKFDIKLYSHTIKQYIERISNGNFEVSLPISDKLRNKKLAVYYIGPQGTKEKYEVEIRNDKAVFRTKHFSEYILAVEENEVQNPVTGDRLLYSLALIPSLLIIEYAVFSRKRR